MTFYLKFVEQCPECWISSVETFEPVFLFKLSNQKSSPSFPRQYLLYENGSASHRRPRIARNAFVNDFNCYLCNITTPNGSQLGDGLHTRTRESNGIDSF